MPIADQVARCRHVPEASAHEVIAGYTIANDVSVRDWQLRTPTMTMNKSFDTHGPIGPWVVTADELGDPHALGIKTYVNGELRQDSNTSEMIYDCFQQVADSRHRLRERSSPSLGDPESRRARLATVGPGRDTA